MKIVPPMLTLAALASSASISDAREKKDRVSKVVDDRARTKTKTKPRQRTIFHKDNHASGTNDNDTVKSLLDNVKVKTAEARRKRRETGAGNNIEKITKVKMEDVAQQSLNKKRRSATKKKSVEVESTDDATADVQEGDKSHYDQDVQSPTATKTKVRSSGDAASTPPPAAAPNVVVASEEETLTTTTTTARETMQQRRRDRTADFAHKQKEAEQANDHRRRGSSDSNHPDAEKSGRRSRREESTTENNNLGPNPRPGRAISSSATGKRSVHRDRDMRPDSGSFSNYNNNNNNKHKRDRDRDRDRDLKKSKKSSYSSKSSKGGGNEKACQVRLTNLTKEQWFSDIFWMVHSDKVDLPLFQYGVRAFDDLALLAQDGDPYDLVDFYKYENDDGVLDVDAERGPILKGMSLVFDIPKSGSYDLLTMATSFIFSNDGFVALDGVEINDGDEFYLWGIDAGVEANTQLCWTVQATSVDFPPNADCYFIDEDLADENHNRFPGEGFVHVHSGIHDFQNKGDVDDFLAFTCDDNDADSFVEYFQSIGFWDDFLLYDDDGGRFERDDESFLDTLSRLDFDDFIIVDIALDSDDFDDFCDELDDIQKDLKSAFETLEPQIFDFRTPMMHVKIDC